MITPADLGAKPVYDRVEGSPYQPGDRVRVVDAIDPHVLDLGELVGQAGEVLYLEYSCGSGQRFPHDPMIGVRLEGGIEQEFWREELATSAAEVP